MIIAIDFDGTIVDHDYPAIGEPVPMAIEYMRQFESLGCKLILFTMRSGGTLDDAVGYIEKSGINLYGVNINPRQLSWTDSPKVHAQLYIDDAAFGCPLTTTENFINRHADWSVIGPAVIASLRANSK